MGSDRLTPSLAFVTLADRPANLRVLLSSLVIQTRMDFEIVVLDQSVAGNGGRAAHCSVADVCDEFFSERGGGPLYGMARLIRVPRVGDWGQTVKHEACCAHVRTPWVTFPNDDSYFTPVYVERMLQAAEGGNDVVACQWIFDKFGYVMYTPKPQAGWVDVGGFIARRDLIVADGWQDRTYEGDGHLVERLVAGGARWGVVPGCLYVKN